MQRLAQALLQQDPDPAGRRAEQWLSQQGHGLLKLLAAV
jgi:hypothetical protein